MQKVFKVKNLVNIFYEVCILFLSFYCLILFYQMVENSGKHITGFDAVLVFNSALKGYWEDYVQSKNESVCINSLFIPFTHWVLLCPFLCSAVTLHFLWLLNLRSVLFWASNSALWSVVTHLLFPDWQAQAFKYQKNNCFLFIDALN